MNIPREIMNTIKEQETARKRRVLILALSEFKIKDGRIVASTLADTGEEYYYQLEPVILKLAAMNEKLNNIIVLSTTKTREPKSFAIADKEYKDCSELDYFSEFARKRWSDVIIDSIDLIDTKDSEKAETNEIEAVKGVVETVRSIAKEEEAGIRLTIDIHGGFRRTQMLVDSVITLLRFEQIVPSEVYTVEYDLDNRIGKLENASDVFDINNYVAGMSEFFSYGRTSSLEKYVDKRLIKLIGNISDSIQLCHLLNFDNAIKELKKYVDEYEPKGDYNDLFIGPIKGSYGPLMDEKGRNVVTNKVKWCVDNDYIQQALTIIESQMPDELLRRNVVTYRYDDEVSKRVKLYQEYAGNELKEVEGGIVLSEAIKYRKPAWERINNYALIPWIRVNCCNKARLLFGGKTEYVSRLEISGTNQNEYLNYNVDDVKLDSEYVLKGVNDNKNVVKLAFEPNKSFDVGDIRNLIRLLMLHYELKEQRNVANHADGKMRADLEEVRTAINAYVTLAERVLSATKKQKVD